MKKVFVDGVEISHRRLIELTKLADQAKPFYDWVEQIFQSANDNRLTLDANLRQGSLSEIQSSISACFYPDKNQALPLLFDGIGRPYRHHQACFYFFAWLIRDAPQQRLSGIISTISNSSQKNRPTIQIEVLANLIFAYRESVKTFEWLAIREILIDRLEGSRRSLKGHEKEVIARTALLEAIQSFYAEHKSYGIYKQVEINDKQIKIKNETYDVNAILFGANSEIQRRILMPVKTRETQGGGHSHLFSRDLTSALLAVEETDIVIVIIVAQVWSEREVENLATRINHLVVLNISPSDFDSLPEVEQKRLNQFIRQVLEGKI